MKILTVVGTRPQLVKAAPVSSALDSVRPPVREVLLHTGQHYDRALSGLLFEELGLPEPDHHLGVGSGLHGLQTARMLEGCEDVLRAERPDAVLLYGDTNSTLAGALAASKLPIPIAHVEAGVRSGVRDMPEEINRLLTDRVATWLLCPTDQAAENLALEGIHEGVHVVGDVMLDAFLEYSERARGDRRIIHELGLDGGHVLATIHRAENTDEPARLRAIFKGLGRIARHRLVVLPLHPRTRKAMDAHDLQPADALHMIDPVGYLDMLELERTADVVVTDSGGVQKEAFFHRVPCITLREETEWVELVDAGWNRLVPPENPASVVDAVREATAEPLPEPPQGLFGDGRAAERVADVLREAMSPR